MKKRECKVCKKTKILRDFVNQILSDGKKFYRYTCKECANARRRTGRPNTGRFQKGHSRGKRYKKKQLPWNTGYAGTYKIKRKSKTKYSAKLRDWIKEVKKTANWKCMKCGSTKLLAAHHIRPWKDCPELRFDINNGIALCASCHAKEEGLGIKIRP